MDKCFKAQKRLRTRSGKAGRNPFFDHLPSTFSFGMSFSFSSLTHSADWLCQLLFTCYNFRHRLFMSGLKHHSPGNMTFGCCTSQMSPTDPINCSQEGGSHHTFRDAGSSVSESRVSRRVMALRLDSPPTYLLQNVDELTYDTLCNKNM